MEKHVGSGLNEIDEISHRQKGSLRLCVPHAYLSHSISRISGNHPRDYLGQVGFKEDLA